MKKLIIILGVALAIAGVAVVTCPDKAAHKNAIMAVINEKIFDSMHLRGMMALPFSPARSDLESSVLSLRRA